MIFGASNIPFGCEEGFTASQGPVGMKKSPAPDSIGSRASKLL
jgi:hypothetical protein